MADPHEAVIVTDASWRVLYGNAAACQLLGCTMTELLGASMRDTFQASQDEPEEILRELHSGHNLRFRSRLRRRDGGQVLADVHWEILDDGRLRAMIRAV